MSNTEQPKSAGEPEAPATEPAPLIRWDNVVEEGDRSPEAKRLIDEVHSQR